MTKWFSREERDLAFVPRWSVVRSIHQQSVAEHCFFVVSYTYQICNILEMSREDTLRAVEYAIVHDMSEAYTGDWSGPAKRSLVTDDAAAQNWVNHQNAARFNVVFCTWVAKYGMIDKIRQIVKCADLIDEALHMAGEAQMGNASVQGVNYNVLDRLHKATAALEPYGRVEAFNTLKRAINEAVEASRECMSMSVKNDKDVDKSVKICRSQHQG